MKLKPNCLLTRRPIYLIPAARSLFFYTRPWGRLESALIEHGYKASVHPLPFNNQSQREQIFSQSITKLSDTHLVFDSVTILEFEQLVINIQNSTFTVITNSNEEFIEIKKTLKLHYSSKLYNFIHNENHSVLNYNIHRLWLKSQGIKTPLPNCLFLNVSDNVLYKFIDHMVLLAELDFMSDS